MTDRIVLPGIARGTLASEPERLERLERAIPQIRAVLEGETDAVAIQSTLACLLYETLVQASWCGFYRRVGERVLAVGPYQGTMGCLRIEFTRGVCGACARTERIQLVPDVSLAKEHIACDPTTRSELVIPIVAGGRLRGVFDLDSKHLAAFSQREAELLDALLRSQLGRDDVVFG